MSNLSPVALSDNRGNSFRSAARKKDMDTSGDNASEFRDDYDGTSNFLSSFIVPNPWTKEQQRR